MKIRVKKSNWRIAASSAAVFAVCVDIQYISYLYPGISTLQNYGGIIVALISIISLLYRRKIQFPRVVYLYALSVLIVIASTIFQGGNVIACIANFLPMLDIVLVLETNKSNVKNIYTILNTWKWLLLIFVLIDLLTEIMFPDGLYASRYYTDCWLLGYKTNRYVLAFPLMLIWGYKELKGNRKLNLSFYLIVLLCFVDCYLSGATGCSVAIAVFILLYFFMRMVSMHDTLRSQRMIYRFMNYKFFLIFYAILNVIVVGTVTLSGLNILLVFLGKDNTFSGRTLIWANLLKVVRRHILGGVGYIGSEQFANYSQISAGTNAHNAMLQLLMFGGILFLTLYLLLFILSVRRKGKRYVQQELFLMAGIYSLFILGLTSAIMVISPFGLLCFWMMEYEKDYKEAEGDGALWEK